jgi:hypothetical protein
MLRPRLLVSSIAAVIFCACGPAESPQRPHTGGVVKPGSDAERRVLEKIATIPSEQPVTIGGVVVRAEPAYFAASGRMCRRLVLTRRGQDNGKIRLACKDGRSWFYAPEVTATPTKIP